MFSIHLSLDFDSSKPEKASRLRAEEWDCRSYAFLDEVLQSVSGSKDWCN